MSRTSHNEGNSTEQYNNVLITFSPACKTYLAQVSLLIIHSLNVFLGLFYLLKKCQVPDLPSELRFKNETDSKMSVTKKTAKSVT